MQVPIQVHAQIKECVYVNTLVHLQVDTPVLAYGRASQGVQCNSRVKVRAMGGWSQLRTRCMCPCAMCNTGCAGEGTHAHLYLQVHVQVYTQ